MDGLGQLILLGLLGGYTLSDKAPERVAALEVQAIRPAKADRQLDMTLLGWQYHGKHLWDDRLRLGLGATLMHLAHGQGLGALNPGYDGRGLSLRYQRPL